MDPELLVTGQFEDGQRLLEQLARDGVDVTVAFWVRMVVGRPWWELYIGSTWVDAGNIGGAVKKVHAYLTRAPAPSVSLSQVRLVPVSDPAAAAARAIRDRYPGMVPTHYRGERLGDLSVEEVYIYPRIDTGRPVVLSVVRDMKVDQAEKKITVFKKKITLPPGTIVGRAFTVEYSAEHPDGKLSERSVDEAIKNLPPGWTSTVVEEG